MDETTHPLLDAEAPAALPSWRHRMREVDDLDRAILGYLDEPHTTAEVMAFAGLTAVRALLRSARLARFGFVTRSAHADDTGGRPGYLWTRTPAGGLVVAVQRGSRAASRRLAVLVAGEPRIGSAA